MTKLHRGVNLGGWLSQSSLEPQHLATFITEGDFHRISEWGFDHVRIPFDYPLLEDDGEPFLYKEAGLELLDKAITWARSAGLSVVLDMHKAPGFSFSTLADNDLLTNETSQQRFLSLWRTLSERYSSYGHELIFELLNEMVADSAVDWNDLASKAVEAIRSVDSSRTIVVGGNYYNSVHALKDLIVLDDPNIIYTFHFYLPMIVTHQKASWIPHLSVLEEPVHYPGEVRSLKRLVEKVKKNPGAYYEGKALKPLQGLCKNFEGKYLDRAYLESEIQPAVEFRRQHQKPLYCGEFGVISYAPQQTRRNWIGDMVAILDQLAIPYALWSYKSMNFGLVDKNGKVVDPVVLDVVRGAKTDGQETL